MRTLSLPPRRRPCRRPGLRLEQLEDRLPPGDAQLPLYVLVEPQSNGEFKEISRYREGKINDVEGFMKFLRGIGEGRKGAKRGRE